VDGVRGEEVVENGVVLRRHVAEGAEISERDGSHACHRRLVVSGTAGALQSACRGKPPWGPSGSGRMAGPSRASLGRCGGWVERGLGHPKWGGGIDTAPGGYIHRYLKRQVRVDPGGSSGCGDSDYLASGGRLAFMAVRRPSLGQP